MKLVLNLEILLNENNKFVYVYKFEQEDFMKKERDVRDITKASLSDLYVF